MHKWWSLLFGVVMSAALLLFVVAPFVGWWLPKNVSSYGGEVDNLFYLILWTTGFFFVLTEAILVYNMYQYASEPGRKAYYVHGHHQAEVFWTVVPAGILLLLAIVQISAWEKIKYHSQMPEPAHVFEVSARQFEWRIRYPAAEQLNDIVGPWQTEKKEPETAKSWARDPHSDDIRVVNELHVWVNSNVRLYLKTRDVLHSFYLPNLRLKQDAVPGRTIPVWFKTLDWNTVYDEKTNRWVDGYDPETNQHNQPKQIWDLACAELCGWGHYKMQGRLYVHKDKEDYLKWLAHAQEEQQRTKP